MFSRISHIAISSLVGTIMFTESLFATTIIGVQTQTIANNDIIASGWFQGVNDILLPFTVSGANVGIGTSSPISKLTIGNGYITTQGAPGSDILGYTRYPDRYPVLAVNSEWGLGPKDIITLGASPCGDPSATNPNSCLDMFTKISAWSRYPTTESVDTSNYIAIGSTEISGSSISNFSYTPGSFLIGGRVGIGTSSPSTKLEVAGQVKITGGTPGAGKVLTSDANGLASWQTASVGVSSQWTTNGSNISYTGGKVGIGTNSPLYTLDLSGSLRVGNGSAGTIYLGDSSFTKSAGAGWTFGGGLTTSGFMTASQYDATGGSESSASYKVSGGSAGLYFPPTSSVGITTGGSGRLIVMSSGNIGIGTSSPGAKLEVVGQVKITGGTPGAGKVLTSDANGLASWQTASAGVSSQWTTTGSSITYTGGNVGIGVTTPGYALTNIRLAGFYDGWSSYTAVDSSGVGPSSKAFVWNTKNANTDGYTAVIGFEGNAGGTSAGGLLLTTSYGQYYDRPLLTASAAGSDVFKILASGNVGIGTSSPSTKLDINGDIKIGNSSNTCNSTKEGSIRYNATSKVFEGCNGVAWMVLQMMSSTSYYPTTYAGSATNMLIAQLARYNIGLDPVTERLYSMDGVAKTVTMKARLTNFSGTNPYVQADARTITIPATGYLVLGSWVGTPVGLQVTAIN